MTRRNAPTACLADVPLDRALCALALPCAAFAAATRLGDGHLTGAE